MSEKELADRLGLRTLPRSNDRVTTGETIERKCVGPNHAYTPEHAVPSQMRIAPERILSAFNVRSFRREPPHDPQVMLQFIAHAMALAEPVPFIMYWGKGPRPAIAKPDLDCIAFVDAMLDRVRQVYAPGAKLKLLFTDTHALLNGHSEDGVRGYFGEIADYVRRRGIDTCWLGEVLRRSGFTDLDEEHEMPRELGERLVASARKWYFGEGTVEEGALKYYRANMVERRAVEAAYPRSIMITFNSSALRALLPAGLPIFYMYSMRRGLSVKPWFVQTPP